MRNTVHFLLMTVVCFLLIGLPPASADYRELKVNPHKTLAAFSLSNPQNPNFLVIFVSPSCNFCELFLLDTLSAIQKGSPKLADINLAVTMVPRGEGDISIIAGFMCIPQSYRMDAIVEYYQSIRSAIGKKAISSDVARKHYEKVTERYGVSGSKRTKCEANSRSRREIANTFYIANSVRKRNIMPVVVFNGKYMGIQHFKDIKKIVRRKN